jgi:hypothetical protein
MYSHLCEKLSRRGCSAQVYVNRSTSRAIRAGTFAITSQVHCLILFPQWKAEIRQRTTEGMFKVHIHHGKDKLRNVGEVKRYDIVITTYQTLYADFPKKKDKIPGVPEGDSTDEEHELLVYFIRLS